MAIKEALAKKVVIRQLRRTFFNWHFKEKTPFRKASIKRIHNNFSLDLVNKEIDFLMNYFNPHQNLLKEKYAFMW